MAAVNPPQKNTHSKKILLLKYDPPAESHGSAPDQQIRLVKVASENIRKYPQADEEKKIKFSQRRYVKLQDLFDRSSSMRFGGLSSMAERLFPGAKERDERLFLAIEKLGEFANGNRERQRARNFHSHLAGGYLPSRFSEWDDASNSSGYSRRYVDKLLEANDYETDIESLIKFTYDYMEKFPDLHQGVM